MVFVLDKHGKPLMPCTEKRARLLLERGRAIVHHQRPFVIRLKDRVGGITQPLRLKLDPGSKTTGIAIVREAANEVIVINLFELVHRGTQIAQAMKKRSDYRRRRRSHKLRYRPARFYNRRRAKGWLCPSTQSRVDNIDSWMHRLSRWVPLTGISLEFAKFDTHKMQNAEIKGIQYQRGTLHGYDVWEYLLEKWGRECAYCGAKDVPLTKDHIHPRAHGGSDRVSNLAPACKPCNEKKDDQDIRQFLAHDPERLQRVLQQRKTPLKDAAVINACRNKLHLLIADFGLPLELATGAQTKWNRKRLDIPKTHALDAACVGNVNSVMNWKIPTLTIKAMGRGRYQRTLVDANGNPRGYLATQKMVHGFKTGDQVKASVPKRRNAGSHTGRVVVRSTGSFDIRTKKELIHCVSWRYCRLVQRADGYAYA